VLFNYETTQSFFILNIYQPARRLIAKISKFITMAVTRSNLTFVTSCLPIVTALKSFTPAQSELMAVG
jgi:hypothetical protein